MSRYFAARRRLRGLEEREAAGETFWTDTLDARVRRRIVTAIDLPSNSIADRPEELVYAAAAAVARDEGLPLHDLFGADSYIDGPWAVVEQGVPLMTDEIFLSVIEAVYDITEGRYGAKVANEWVYRTNGVLKEARVSFELIEGRIVPFNSRELHTEVVAPTLTLLGGRPNMQSAEDAYQAALREIHEGHPEDAITDCGTALQCALTSLGFTGTQLGEQLKAARNSGLLLDSASPLVDGIGKALSSVASIRNQNSDAHPSSAPVTDADAWLVVHLVGAFILHVVERSEQMR